MPLAYICSISTGLCFFTWHQRHKSHIVHKIMGTLCMLIPVVAITVQLPLFQFADLLTADLHSGSEAHAPFGGRVDEIADWLKTRSHPGDTVQPLDWTGGSIHGMLLAKAKLATQFMYDYHFYHHVSSPVIQGLRQSFISQLRKASPRFIIEVMMDKPWVWGIDTTREFPELRKFLDNCYTVAKTTDGYLIYERKNNTPASHNDTFYDGK